MAGEEAFGGARINFLCSWDNAAPINISVDPKSMKATRSDGGRSYTVTKITKLGVWLMVDEPDNLVSMAVQIIERGEAVAPDSGGSAEAYPAGSWTDVILSISGHGSVSSITGGVCWEQ